MERATSAAEAEAPEAPAATLADEDRETQSIRVSVYRERVLGVTLVLTGILAILTYVLIDGFTVDTTDATALSAADKSDMLDRYNTYSGGVASLVSLPFQPFVGMLVPAFFLCSPPRLS